MKHACKKIIALLLAVVMIIGVLPFASAGQVGPFVDVPDNKWYSEAIEYVYEYLYMNGITKTTFEPDSTCTRAMAATVLYRVEGEPTVSEKATFSDLTAKWYQDSVAWAEDTGVVNGVGNGKFDPDGLVSRQQLVTMIWRYDGSKEPADDTAINSFPDAANVGKYAVKAFNWAINKGIINGKGGKLDPTGNATRAEFAKIIYTYLLSKEPCADDKHEWIDGEVTKEATCTEAGEMIIICSKCETKSTKEIPALGHDYVDGICSRCGEKLAEEGTAVIYYTNDVHTYIDGDLSYDTVAELKAQTSKLLGGNTLLIDAGDHAQGTAFGSMDKGQTMIELMNAAGYDYATLGNHEFDYGMDGAMNLIKWADYKYLSANFYNEKDGVRGENVLDAYTIVELLGKKIALIGITTPETFTKSTPAYFQDENGNYIYGISGGTDGAALYADVQAAIDAAKAEGAEIIIALGHLGDDVASKPWTSEEVIANTTGLNAFIDGHSHSTVEGKEVADKAGNKVLLTQTGEYFGAIGKMTITADGTISTELITDCALSDESVAADKQAWISEVNEKLGVVIGHADVTFDNYVDGNRIVRKQETNTGDFAADALYYLFDVTEGLEVDLAIMNGGGVRNKAITGDISYLTCKEIHTFGNVACLQTVTGQQILDALEWGARDAGAAECGGFLHVSGVTYEIHTYIPSTVQKDDKGVWTGAPTGEYRVKNVMIGGQPLDLNATYNMAGYNYTLRDLGDGFAMFEGAVNVKDYVMEDYMVLANYVKSFPVDATSGLPTITAENSPYGEVTGEGRIIQIAEKPKEDKYVAIYNPANGKVMTTAASIYNNKEQLKSASATVNAEGKLETAAKDVALFKMVTENGITSFITKDGKYLSCDGTNLKFVDAADENTEFVLEDVSGGQYIRLANYLHNGQYAQYVEYYKDVFTCFGISATADVNLYIFNFLEVAEGGSADKEYTLTSELKDGDQVVMYNAGNGKALSSDMNGYNAAGVEIAPEGKVIKTSDATIVWTATKNADGTFTFSQGSKKLMTAFDGTYTNIYFEGDYADTWNVKTANAAKDSYYIYSATEQGSYGDIYLEWYEKKAGFTAYSTGNPSEANFGFQFYTIGGDGGNGTGGDTGETKVFEKVTSDLGDWSGTYVIGWDDGSNAFIFDGINDANENHTASALTDNKVTAPSSSIIVIEAVDGGYTLKAAAGYLNGVEAANKLVFETAPATATIAWNGSNPIITSAVGTIFRFNNNTYDDGTTYSWFRFFKPASSVQTPINLYKLTDGTITPPNPGCTHVWDDGVETIEPECETEGLRVFTCTLCGETKEEKIPALGHIDEDADNKCDDCGKEMPEPGKGGYVKVTETLADFSGEYLLVYEEGALAFDGSLTTLDTKLACLPVEIVDGVISGDYSANIITIAPMGEGTYSIQAASGKYFSHTSATNTLDSADAPAAMTIAIEEGNAIITAEDTYILRFNTTADQMRFRFYKPTSSVKTPVALYKFSGEGGTVTPPTPGCTHVWDDGVETIEPECETEGLCVYTCTLCGETKEVVLEALGHIDEDADNLCDDCNAEMSNGGDDEIDGAFTLAASIKDGDQVVIYNAGNGMAVPAEMLGSYYLAGVAITAENDAIVTEDERIIWTVIDNGDGTFSFSNGDSILSINWNTSNSKTSMSLDGANPKMTVESCNPANHSYYIYSATQEGNYGPIFLEWYAKFTEFSAYSTSFDRVNEEAFGFQFFVRGAEGVCAHVWDDGEVTLEPTCQADGEITYNCTKCEEVKNEVIPALDCVDANGDNKCDTCGATMGGDLEEIAFADLKDGDTIMIVVHTAADMTNKEFVLLSNFGSDPKVNAAVYTGEHDTTMYWTVSITDGVVRFCANGSADYLYSISTSNNGLRVGKDDAGVMGYDATMGYLTTTDNAGNVRYIGVYDNNKGDVSAVPNPNFRGYKLASDGTLANIGNQTVTIYKIG